MRQCCSLNSCVYASFLFSSASIDVLLCFAADSMNRFEFLPIFRTLRQNSVVAVHQRVFGSIVAVVHRTRRLCCSIIFAKNRTR
uniref:Tyrosine-protein phosphatase domain-containing protein n=1 Tax=Parascaris univalens TaxID=6257 RepID=A0A914ZY12_PARUN